MDVTDKDSITAAVHVVEEKSGKLDILVNKYIQRPQRDALDTDEAVVREFMGQLL